MDRTGPAFKRRRSALVISIQSKPWTQLQTLRSYSSNTPSIYYMRIHPEWGVTALAMMGAMTWRSRQQPRVEHPYVPNQWLLIPQQA
jgi:hypothetical protein